MTLPLTAGTDYSGTLDDLSVIGCATVGDMDFAFVLLKLIDDAGNTSVQLSAATCSGGTWATAWAKLDQPPGGIDFAGTYQDTAFAIDSVIWVYVLSGDGHLWCRCWNGGWIDWVKCDVADLTNPQTAPAYPLTAVDHVLDGFVFVADANGQAWAMALADGQWSAVKEDASVLLRSQGKPLAFLLGGGGYYCALTISDLALLPRLYLDAGISTGRYVQITPSSSGGGDVHWSSPQYGPDDYGSTIFDPVQVCIAGWLPSNPAQIIYSDWCSSTGATASITIDMTEFEGAENGMLCWVMVQGGRAYSDFVQGIELPGDYGIGSDSSAANFNYRSDLADPNMAVAYDATVKGTTSKCYWSFGSAYNFEINLYSTPISHLFGSLVP